MLVPATNANLIKGFCLANYNQEITFLHFADDTLLFFYAEGEQLCNINVILSCFEVVLGLIVNFFRSELIGNRVNGNRLALLADHFGWRACSLPLFYLGLPLCIGVASKSLWSLVLEWLEKKLSLWANYLSLGGRINLIEDVLANLPVYFMSLFNCMRLSSALKNYKGISYVMERRRKRTKLSSAKEKGGLGISPLKEMNLVS